MPEGPEILEFTRRINDFANGRVFESLVKSSNHRSSLPERIFPYYTVSAKCRGKEFLVTMIETDKAGIASLPENRLYLLFAMGMVGTSALNLRILNPLCLKFTTNISQLKFAEQTT